MRFSLELPVDDPAAIPRRAAAIESADVIEGVQEHDHVVIEGTQNIRDGSTVVEAAPPNSPS